MSPRKPLRWTVACDCGWSYSNVVKSDVEQQVRWHRCQGALAAALAEADGS